MRLVVICLGLLCSFSLLAKETRCGWLENASPANLWLIDRDSSWDVTIQGVRSELDDKSIDLVYEAMANKGQFVQTNNSYGFSCACLIVDTDKEVKRITAVYGSRQLSLKQCLEDISISKTIPLRFK